MYKNTSNEDLSRIKTIPGQNSIYFNAMLARGGTGSRWDSHTNLRSTPVRYGVAPEPVFIYTIYVRRKDYAHARELVLGA
jgi:hypothetical protein